MRSNLLTVDLQIFLKVCLLRKYFPVPVRSRRFPLCLLSGSVYLVWFWDIRFIWCWALYRVIDTDLFWFFYILPSSLTSIIWWRTCLISSVYVCLLYHKPGLHIYVSSCLDIQFDSINLSFEQGKHKRPQPYTKSTSKWGIARAEHMTFPRKSIPIGYPMPDGQFWKHTYKQLYTDDAGCLCI